MIQQAFISGQIGKVIYAEDDRYFVLSVDQLEEPVECRPMDISTFFNHGAEYITVSGPQLDLAQLKNQLVAQRRAYHALTLTISGLDKELDYESRAGAIGAAETLVKREPTRHFVRARMLARPLPEEADMETALDISDSSDAKKTGDLYRNILLYERSISLVYETWMQAAPNYFSSHEERIETERMLIDLGVFAELVTALATRDIIMLNSIVVTYGQKPELNFKFGQAFLILKDLRTRLLRKAGLRDNIYIPHVEAPQKSDAAALRGAVAAQSSISYVDGNNGTLLYQGINIHDLASNSTFEEVVFLLWNGRLPRRAELDELKRSLAANQELSPEMLALLRRFPREAEPMDVLRTTVSALAFYDRKARDTSREGALRTATRLTAQLPVLVAAWDRIRDGKEPIAARPDLNIAANFLYMLRGELPTLNEARILDVCLILYADFELNASTFTARVVAGTHADMYSGVTAAIAAIAGPLHGGASENVMKILFDIGSADRAESWLRDALAQKRKILGFGHATFRTEDPRATHMRELSMEMAVAKGDGRWVDILEKLQKVMSRNSGLRPNVDYYSGSIFYAMGIRLDLFTPVFAISRISGWAGHILEQYADNRLIRPRAEYLGMHNVPYIPIEQR